MEIGFFSRLPVAPMLNLPFASLRAGSPAGSLTSPCAWEGRGSSFVLLPFTCCVLPFICTQTDSYNNTWGAEVGGRVDRKSSVMKKEQRALESDRPVRFEPARGLALGVHLLQFIEP